MVSSQFQSFREAAPSPGRQFSDISEAARQRFSATFYQSVGGAADDATGHCAENAVDQTCFETFLQWLTLECGDDATSCRT